MRSRTRGCAMLDAAARGVAATCCCSSATRCTPTTRRRSPGPRIERRDATQDDSRLAAGRSSADFEEYTWLYHESWTPDDRALGALRGAQRDDLRRPRRDRRLEHLAVVGRRHPRGSRGGRTTSSAALVSYWVYQHLGNLSPRRDPRRGHARPPRAARATATEFLHEWARASERSRRYRAATGSATTRDLGRRRASS